MEKQWNINKIPTSIFFFFTESGDRSLNKDSYKDVNQLAAIRTYANWIPNELQSRNNHDLRIYSADISVFDNVSQKQPKLR